ncbi:MAG: DUF4070 domain-containing protein [Bacteroidota bacterium]
MNILLIYPEYRNTFFSFQHALQFISRKAVQPPLGLITVSALLPSHWNKKLLDLNISPLQAKDLAWADYVFISAMHVQKESVDKILAECSKYGVKTMAGGPLFTLEYEDYPQVDHFILNEAEITLTPLLDAMETGGNIRRISETKQFADMSQSPVPDFHLLNKNAYASMAIQLSRGCPFACDFCEIPVLLGQKVRIKHADQIIRELDALYALKWRGSVSIVDDNFMGNKKEIKNNMLPAIHKWMREHSYPFIFNIQTSVDLADDTELIAMMIDAGIYSTFIGIETPSEYTLNNCNKVQNRNRDLLQNVIDIQKAGMFVSGGFIVGFDSDTPEIFQQQADFIQQSGIIWAMVSLLNAPKNTRLYQRLESENRLTTEVTGNNTDFTMNFTPRMPEDELLQGYHSIIHSIYEVKPYYERIQRSLMKIGPVNRKVLRIDRYYLRAFFRSILIIGILNKGRGEFWSLLFWTLFHRPNLFLYTVMYAICGYHFRRVYQLS